MKTLQELKMEPDSSHAVVELTVEVRTESWGPDCTLQQAISQATEQATSRLRKLLANDKGVRVIHANTVQVVCPAKRQS